MPRQPRNCIQSSFFHVMVQGINKSYIFEYPEDIKFYIKNMYKYTQELNINIISYCIMNNHAHLLIKAEDVKELSKYMHRLNTIYGKYYNTKYNRVGYVFRDRYKTEAIISEKQLYCCIRYIYNNPVKASICKEAKDYPYSNYRNISINYPDNYKFMDIDNDVKEDCKIIIYEFLTKNNITSSDLKKNIIKLKELIHILKTDFNISLRLIAEVLEINREKIRRIYNKN